MNPANSPSNAPSRRQFISASAALGAVAALDLSLPHAAYAAGDDLLRVGLVGCGGRGTGAAAQALTADSNCKLTAMADAFPDALERSLKNLQAQKAVADRVDVPPERQFVGFDACQQLIDSGVDVVLLATPPHFRPMHLKAAVDAGKHVFAEKPVAVDAPGVRSVLATCEQARAKKLSIVSGLCLRYSHGFQQAIERIHGGAIGDVLTLFANDYRGPIWTKERQPQWSDMEYQLRNWYYYTWLSGDFNVEQHVHNLDVCVWLMKDQYPDRVVAMGGRQVRTGPAFGHIYDNFSAVYEYTSGTRLISNTRQQSGCARDISNQVIGSGGFARVSEKGLNIQGGKPWTFEGKDNNFYVTEHEELFRSIRNGEAINNGDYMAKSTLLAIMARMSAYTGQAITWDQAMSSTEDLSPPSYEWGPLPTPPVAMPGVTKFA